MSVHKVSEKVAETIVKKIVNDMCGRSGGDHWFCGRDREVRQEIRDAWKAIVLKEANK